MKIVSSETNLNTDLRKSSRQNTDITSQDLN
jgi:hypothetical protein